MYNIKPVEKRNVTDEVFEQIKQNILNKVWNSGSQLPAETELANMFGVSRVSIRTALQRLIALGVLEARSGEGTFVKEISSSMFLNPLIPVLMLEPKHILDLLELRKGIELVSCELAALRATEEEIIILGEYLEKMKKSTKEDDVKNFAENDFEFHIQIARMSKNSAIESILMIFKEPFIIHFAQMTEYFLMKDTITHHIDVYEAIKRRDAQKAVSCLGRNLQIAIEMTKEIENELNSKKSNRLTLS